MVQTSGYVLAAILETETIRPLLRLLHQLHHLFTKTVCCSSIYNFYYKTIVWVQARPNTPSGQLFQAQSLAVLTELSEEANPSQQRQYYQGEKWVLAKATCIPQVCCLCSHSLPSVTRADWAVPMLERNQSSQGSRGCSKLSWEMWGARGHLAVPGLLMSLKRALLLCDMIISQYVFPQYVAPEAIDSDIKLSSLNNFLTCPF